MNVLKTKRLVLLETAHVRQTIVSPIRCVAFAAWCQSDPVPSCLTGNGLLCDTSAGRLLSHLLVDDEARGLGFGTEIVRFYEDRLGTFGACWASTGGAAFANRYMQRFGPRPIWRISPPSTAMDRIMDARARRELDAKHAAATADVTAATKGAA